MHDIFLIRIIIIIIMIEFARLRDYDQTFHSFKKREASFNEKEHVVVVVVSNWRMTLFVKERYYYEYYYSITNERALP